MLILLSSDIAIFSSFIYDFRFLQFPLYFCKEDSEWALYFLTEYLP